MTMFFNLNYCHLRLLLGLILRRVYSFRMNLL